MSNKLSLLQEAGHLVSAFLRQEIPALLRENAARLPPTRTLPVLRDFPAGRVSYLFTGRRPTPARSPFRPPHSFLRCLTAGSLRHYFSQVDALQTFSLGVLRFRAPDRTCPGFRVSWAPPPTPAPVPFAPRTPSPPSRRALRPMPVAAHDVPSSPALPKQNGNP